MVSAQLAGARCYSPGGATSKCTPSRKLISPSGRPAMTWESRGPAYDVDGFPSLTCIGTSQNGKARSAAPLVPAHPEERGRSVPGCSAVSAGLRGDARRRTRWAVEPSHKEGAFPFHLVPPCHTYKWPLPPYSYYPRARGRRGAPARPDREINLRRDGIFPEPCRGKRPHDALAGPQGLDSGPFRVFFSPQRSRRRYVGRSAMLPETTDRWYPDTRHTLAIEHATASCGASHEPRGPGPLLVTPCPGEPVWQRPIDRGAIVRNPDPSPALAPAGRAAISLGDPANCSTARGRGALVSLSFR